AASIRSVKWEEYHPHDSPHQTAKKRPRVEEESDDYRDIKKTRGVHRLTTENSREATPVEHDIPVRPKKKDKGEVTLEEREVGERPKKEVRKLLKKKRKGTPEEEVRDQIKKKGKETPEEEVTERPKKKGKETPKKEVRPRPKKKGNENPEEDVRQRPKKKEKGAPEEVVREQPRTKEGKEASSQEDESDDCWDLRKKRGDHIRASKRTKKMEERSAEEEISKKSKGVAAPVGEETTRGPRQESMKKPGKYGVSKELETKKLLTPGGPLSAAHQTAPDLTQKEETSSSSSDQEDGDLSRRAGCRPPVMAQQTNGSSSPDLLGTKKPLISSPKYNGHVAQGAAPHRALLQTAGRGAGRGQGTDNLPWRGRGFRGRGESQPQNHFFYSPETIKEQQLNEDASNVSVLIQNPPEAVNKDYSALPLLAAPPQPGKIIAFKLLELTENYSPEVSDYKEGRVLSYDAVSQELEVEVLSQQKKKEPGKFDLIYEGEDGMDIVEYAVPQESKITQGWSSLIEPRLVTESHHPALLTPGP
ncbi:coilin, partial [Phyllobates terribilis]|uniref:coilin n=1 Tax=Phyllobates terribilis TaxID=111132 RepID=UPI003CCAE003